MRQNVCDEFDGSRQVMRPNPSCLSRASVLGAVSIDEYAHLEPTCL